MFNISTCRPIPLQIYNRSINHADISDVRKTKLEAHCNTSGISVNVIISSFS